MQLIRFFQVGDCFVTWITYVRQPTRLLVVLGLGLVWKQLRANKQIVDLGTVAAKFIARPISGSDATLVLPEYGVGVTGQIHGRRCDKIRIAPCRGTTLTIESFGSNIDLRDTFSRLA